MTTLDIILQGFMNALCITALFFALEDGMIFAPLRRILDRRVKSQFVAKPLYQCTICMSSFWSIVTWIVKGVEFDIFSLAWVILVTAGFNVLFSYPIAHVVFKYQMSRTNDNR